MERTQVQSGKKNQKPVEEILYGKGYVRLCETVQTKGDLVEVNSEKIKSIIKSGSEKDWYTSLYYYGSDAAKHWKENNSMKGYKGSAHSNKLLFDFDSENAPHEAKSDACSLLERLAGEGVDVASSCRVFFSGNKGFHVEVIVDKEFTPEELKPICKNLAVDLKTWDSSVYNTTRLVRLINTKHQKSGLYKIELSPDDLLNKSMDEIKEMAKQPVQYPEYKLEPVKDLDFLKKYEGQFSPLAKPVEVDVTDIDGIRGLDGIDFSKMPRGMPRCIYALSHGVMKPGERNHLFFRLAAYFRNQGMTKDVCYNTLKGVARENKRLYPEAPLVDKEEIWNTVVSSVYDDSTWKQVPGATGTDTENELLKKYCNAVGESTDKKCSLHGAGVDKAKPVQISDVFDNFKNFAENFDRNSVRTGLDFIDKNMNIAVGTTTLIVGASGSGKTTLGLNIMENANSLGQHTVFFSLDMHQNLVYLKLAQKLTSYSQKQILHIFKTKQQDKMEEIRNLISKKYGMTFFDFNSTLTMNQMRDKVLDIQEKNGVDVKMVLVDYASRITGDFKDSYAQARANALNSTGVAADTNAAWLYISQISRQVGDSCTPLRTKRAAKESGDWEESATNVITVWRPFEGDPERDDVMRMYLAKNRMGQQLEQVLHWDGSKGLIRDMSDFELADYEDLRGLKEEKEYLKSKYAAKHGG
jgi:KaiC/GvpD/RAD55 family RecA-like ATPase